LNITVGFIHAGSHRNIRAGHWAKNVENHADGSEVFVHGLIANARNIVGFENYVTVRTDVDYTADSLQAGAIPSPR
jgi:hypothetical protein